MSRRLLEPQFVYWRTPGVLCVYDELEGPRSTKSAMGIIAMDRPGVESLLTVNERAHKDSPRAKKQC